MFLLFCHYCYLFYCGRCNNHLLLADVIAKYVMADVVGQPFSLKWNISHSHNCISIYVLLQKVLCNKIHSQFSCTLLVLAVLMKYMFQNLEQCRVYLSVSECKNLLVYSDLWWELVLFLFNTVSAVVEYMALQKLEIELLNFYLHQFLTQLISYHNISLIFVWIYLVWVCNLNCLFDLVWNFFQFWWRQKRNG